MRLRIVFPYSVNSYLLIKILHIQKHLDQILPSQSTNITLLQLPKNVQSNFIYSSLTALEVQKC